MSQYIEGGCNMSDTNDVAIERRMARQRRTERAIREERARVRAIIVAGTEDDNEAPAEWFDQ